MYKNTSTVMRQALLILSTSKHGIRNLSCAIFSTCTTTIPSIAKFQQLKYSNVKYFKTVAPYFNKFSTEIKTNSADKAKDEKVNIIPDEIMLDIPEKLGLFQKFKLMYKKYWYVLIPVHVVTSIGWFGGFYYLSKSGVDIAALLQALHVNDGLIEKMKNSNMGHYAISYLCYKIATPIRYGVTLGGTTLTIKYLVKHGYIKPVPTKAEFIKMYEAKKALRAKRKQHNQNKE